MKASPRATRKSVLGQRPILEGNAANLHVQQVLQRLRALSRTMGCRPQTPLLSPSLPRSITTEPDVLSPESKAKFKRKIDTYIRCAQMRGPFGYQMFVNRLKVGNGLVVYGMVKFQALEFNFTGPEISSTIPCLAGESLKFQNSGTEIWQIHPPTFHTPQFACLVCGELAVVQTVVK